MILAESTTVCRIIVKSAVRAFWFSHSTFCVHRELIVKKYVEEFAAQSKDICDKCWAYNLCRVCYAGVCNENGLDMGLKNEACRASRSVALNNLALYHELMEENPEALNCLKDAVIE